MVSRDWVKLAPEAGGGGKPAAKSPEDERRTAVGAGGSEVQASGGLDGE